MYRGDVTQRARRDALGCRRRRGLFTLIRIYYNPITLAHAINLALGAQHASNLVESLEKTLSNAPVETLWDADAVEVCILSPKQRNKA